MNERGGAFASGTPIELGSFSLPDGVVFRVGRATHRYRRVEKGDLFIEAFRNGSFLMHAPLKLDDPAVKGAFGVQPRDAKTKIASWGLATAVRSTPGLGVSRVTVAVSEGVVWVDYPTA